VSSNGLIGIDLGTTNTCAAFVHSKVPRVIPSDQGRLILPSVVAMSERGEVLVGAVAKDQMIVNPTRSIYGHKRLIGRSFRSPTVQGLRERFTYELVEGEGGQAAVLLNDQVTELREISAIILRHVKTVARQALGLEIDAAVITVPAYFNERQREVVKEAGRLAGLEVKRIVNEPTAAALAYGFNRGFEQLILVYDLGGGTFDVSLLRLHGNVFEVIATGGDTFLGGADFDERIVDHVLESFKHQEKIDLRDDRVVLQRIKGAAEAAKMDLSLMSNVVMDLPFVTSRKGKPVDLRVPLSRERLNQLTRDLVERTFVLCDQVMEEAGVDPRTIDEVLLVGGQTRMPLVQGRIHQHFGRPPRKGVHPDEVVAMGAALLGDSLDEIDSVTLIDVLSMPIGIATPGGHFKPVLPKNSSLPLQKRFGLPPPREGQAQVELDLFQGESAKVEENAYLGTIVFPRDIKELVFELDAEGILIVKVNHGGKSETVRLSTEDTPSSLRAAWDQADERKRLLDSENKDQSSGLLSSIRKVFGGNS